LLKILAPLPLLLFHVLGIALGHVVYRCSARYRRIFLANLRQAGFDQPAVRRQAIAEAGKAVMELIPVWFRPQSAVAALVQDVSLLALIAQARARDKGVIFITPHMGCFEVAAQWYAQLHGPLTALYSPPKRGLFSRLVSGGRAKPQLHLATPDLRGVRAMLAALKRKEAIAILPDQVPGRGEGQWAPFFGRPAWTMVLAQRLAKAGDASLILVWAERLSWGRGYRCHGMAWPEPQEAGAATGAGPATEQATQHAAACDLNQALETIIRVCPQQYLWGYNRYKVPAGVTPPAPLPVSPSHLSPIAGKAH
jgi:Kdo2-lipid IVA lauroyltransferase/acyltransferase